MGKAPEDLAVFCRVEFRAGSLESPTGWTYRVAINLANSYHRRRPLTRRLPARLDPPRQERDHAEATVDAEAMRTLVASLPAAGPTRGVDPDALWRAARRHLWVQRLAAVLIVAGLGTGAVWLLDQPGGVVIGDDGRLAPADQPAREPEPTEPYSLPLFRTIAVRTIDTFDFDGATVIDQQGLRALWSEIGPEGPAPALPPRASAAVVGHASTGCAELEDIGAVSFTSEEVVVHLRQGASGLQEMCDSPAERVVYVVAVPVDAVDGRTARLTVQPPPPDAVPVPLPVVSEVKLRRVALAWMQALADGDATRTAEMVIPSASTLEIESMISRVRAWQDATGAQGQPVAGRVIQSDAFLAVCVGLSAGEERLEGGLMMRTSVAVSPPGWRPWEYRGLDGCRGGDGRYGDFADDESSTGTGILALLFVGVGAVILVGDRQARRWAAAHPGPRRTRQDPGRDYPYTQTWRY